MYRHFSFLLIFLILLAFGGCQKDTGDPGPAITLTSPTENQAFNVTGEIGIKGSVYDDGTIEYIRIQLLNEQMTPALPAQQIIPEGNQYTLNLAYALDDPLMEGGKYYLQVQASDGVHVNNKYVALQITAVPKKLRYFLAVTQSGNTLHVVKIDSAFQTTTLLTVNSDYLGSGVCNDYGLFYLGGSYTGDIHVYDMSQWQEQWNVPVTVSPPFAWFTGMMVSGGYLWVGYQTGKYEKYDLYGNKKMAINSYNAYAPRKFCLAGDKLITEEKSTTGPQTMLTVRFEYSGALSAEYPVSEQTVALVPVDATNICHITNSYTGQAHLYLFNTEIPYEEEVEWAFDNGKAWCAIPMKERILIGHDQGIYVFSPADLSSYLWIGGNSVKTLFHDESHGWLLAGEGKQLKIYADMFSLNILIKTVDLNDSIVSVHGVYNKD